MSSLQMRSSKFEVRSDESNDTDQSRKYVIPHSAVRTPHWTGLLLQVLASIITLSGTFMATEVHALSGREIFEKVHDVSVQALDHEITMTMVLFDKGGGKRTRALTSYSKNASPEAYKALAVFKTPPDLKNVGFLVHARTFSDRDLWAYFPEYKRVRRIANASQDDSFFGSDLSYDDFTGPANLDDFKFTMEREEVVDGRTCYVVEVIPKTRRKYTRYLSWVARDLWVQVRIEYYQDKEIYRQGAFRDIRMIDGIPTPFRSEMENKKTSHRTELTIDSVRYHTQFGDDLFTQRSLERAGK